MRAYVAHNMDGNEDFLASLEMTKSEVTVARKLAEEGVSLLKKAEKENEVVQAEGRQLAEKKEAMAADKKKIEEEAA